MYNKRAGIEGTFSQGIRSVGLRRSRYRGLSKTHLQNVAITCAMNLQRRRLLERNPTCLDTYLRLRADRAMDHLRKFANGIRHGPRTRPVLPG